MAKQIDKKQKASKSLPTEQPEVAKTMPFGKMNYILVIVGVLLMIGGGSSDPDVFNEKMFDFQHITLAPILILLGFVIEIVAIFFHKKQ